MEKYFTEIAKYLLPSFVSLAATVLVVWLFIKKERDYRQFEISLKNKNTTLPLRLQAYERLSLLLERLEPNSLVTRMLPEAISTRDYQMVLITAIKAEFDHNLSQQIYVSAQVWASVVAVKNSLINTIITLGVELGDNAPAGHLSRAILKHYSSQEEGSPNESALELIRQEVKRLF